MRDAQLFDHVSREGAGIGAIGIHQSTFFALPAFNGIQHGAVVRVGHALESVHFGDFKLAGVKLSGFSTFQAVVLEFEIKSIASFFQIVQGVEEGIVVSHVEIFFPEKQPSLWDVSEKTKRQGYFIKKRLALKKPRQTNLPGLHFDKSFKRGLAYQFPCQFWPVGRVTEPAHIVGFQQFFEMVNTGIGHIIKTFDTVFFQHIGHP